MNPFLVLFRYLHFMTISIYSLNNEILQQTVPREYIYVLGKFEGKKVK